jgi:selenocysteine lyase/cysteine desulfurase
MTHSSSALALQVSGRQQAAKPEHSLEILGRILASGSDGRLALHPSTDRNGYGCRALPHPDAIAFSSSTANTISPRAFAAVEAAYGALFVHAAETGLATAYEIAVEALRRELKLLLELDICDADIVFSPSGTDSEVHALHLARELLGGDITSIIVAAEETGSGVPLAAGGRHFAETTSSGASVTKGQPIAGMAGVTHVTVPAGDAQGARSLAQVDADVAQAVAASLAAGRRAVVHVMHHSKIGTRAPSAACIAALRAEHGMGVQFILDACQFRLSRHRLRHYLEQGFLVLVTGSKFFAGPPLSGALIVPEQLRARLAAAHAVPAGFADYSSATDWPMSLAGIRSQLPQRENLGQYLRWAAACAEMHAYYTVPELYRRIAMAEFARSAARAIERHECITLLPEPAWLSDDSDVDDEFSERTVFPFTVKALGRLVTPVESRAIYKALNDDVTRIVDCTTPAQAKLAATICHIGQPVTLKVDGVETGALRISADARLVSECFAGADMSGAIAPMQRKFAQIDVVFGKVELLAQNLDRVVAVYA